MKLNNFRGELTDIPAKKEPLARAQLYAVSRQWRNVLPVQVLHCPAQLLAGVIFDFLSWRANGHLYYKYTVYIIYILYVYIQLFTYLAGRPQCQKPARQQLCCPGGWPSVPVLPFQPNYRLAHPKKYLFLLSKKKSGSKYPKKYFYLILKKEALVSSCPVVSAQSMRVVRSTHFLQTWVILNYVSVQHCDRMR